MMRSANRTACLSVKGLAPTNTQYQLAPATISLTRSMSTSLDAVSYFVLCKLTEGGIGDAEATSKKVAAALAEHSSCRMSETEMREARNKVTFAIMKVESHMEKATATVEALFDLLRKSFRQ